MNTGSLKAAVTSSVTTQFPNLEIREISDPQNTGGYLASTGKYVGDTFKAI